MNAISNLMRMACRPPRRRAIPRGRTTFAEYPRLFDEYTAGSPTANSVNGSDVEEGGNVFRRHGRPARVSAGIHAFTVVKPTTNCGYSLTGSMNVAHGIHMFTQTLTRRVRRS